MHNSSEHSTILLAILGIDAQPEQLEQLTLSLLEHLFRPFGVLRKIVIFLRDGVVKAFIEYSAPEESCLARLFLHDCLLNSLGKLKVFFSALQKLDLAGRQIETKDFQVPKNTRLSILSNAKVSKGNPTKKTTNTKPPIILSRMPKSNEATLKKELSEHTYFNNKENKENLPNKIQLSVLTQANKTVSTPSENKTPFNPQLEIETPSDSKVILVSNVDDFFVEVSQIFNVFSCFGNIAKILFMKNLKKALVEFKKHESGELAVKGVNNCTFGKTKIKVALSKFRQIDLKRNNKSENSQNFNEVMVVASHMNRFKNNLPDVVLPTDTLRAVVAKGDSVQLSDLLLGIKLCAKPVKIRTVEEEDQEGTNHEVLFRFSNVQEALKVLAQSHNSLISGHSLQLSFADVRI